MEKSRCFQSITHLILKHLSRSWKMGSTNHMAGVINLDQLNLGESSSVFFAGSLQKLYLTIFITHHCWSSNFMFHFAVNNLLSSLMIHLPSIGRDAQLLWGTQHTWELKPFFLFQLILKWASHWRILSRTAHCISKTSDRMSVGQCCLVPEKSHLTACLYWYRFIKKAIHNTLIHHSQDRKHKKKFSAYLGKPSPSLVY